MQVHPFTAEEPFVDRMGWIAFYGDSAFFILMHEHAATCSAITADGGERVGMLRPGHVDGLF
jgi:hypothetical protein